MPLASKLGTVIREPAIAIDYVGWLAQAKLLRRDPILRLNESVDLGGFANFSEFHHARHFLSRIEAEYLVSQDIREGVIIDVGANIGVFSLVLAKHWGKPDVHAIEPNPSTFKTLVANVTRNGLRNIRCHMIAIAETSGLTMFNADPSSRGTASIAKGSGRFVQQVDCVSLDDFVANNGIDRISLLKIDVEGFEAFVLRGGARTLENIRPRLIHFEVCAENAIRHGFDPAEPARILLDCGYALRRWDIDGKLMTARVDEVDKSRSANWIALSQ